MIAYFEPTDAQVLGALIAASATVTVAVLARQSNKQRGDHAATAAKVDQLLTGQDEIRADLRDVKADVREVREEQRQHSDRLGRLERMDATLTATEQIVARPRPTRKRSA